MKLSFWQKLRKLLFLQVLWAILLFTGCSSSRLSNFSSVSQKHPFTTSFHGLVVMDANSGKTLHNTNGNKYFIPASNVKIFTLFASKKLLPQKAPALEYILKNDTTYVKGTGYPGTFHPYFEDSTAISFLKEHKNVSLFLSQEEISRYGPGWAWEDFDTYFSPENNDFPLYGNVLTAYPGNEKRIVPAIFKDSIFFQDNPFRREERSNQFHIDPVSKDTIGIPFITSKNLTQKMLENVLSKKVGLTKEFPAGKKQILMGLETDSIIKRMMYVSDNFLAEQLLLMSSGTLSDTLSTKKVITHILENELSDLNHQPRWVDGSGLSRYNLFTPESMVHVLHRMYQEISHEELFPLFPAWDGNGTIEEWNQPGETRYVFAKSGGMGNTYNLSGYLKTKSGKILIFSSMNNHYRVPSSTVRKEIELILESLREKY
ncbi:D-alanyl-D-alanine carboxypeptidase [Flagellimonas sp.]|uniref:D-alanyl-D-alanine carboxypeptidase n=1 Tax=Flagellimonas sp. TaxID=2058762 RepID=UPI003F49D6F5